MTNNIFDRVNYAIMCAFFSRPLEEQIFNASPADNEDLAKAAIEALREPTEEMKIAGSIDPGAGGPDHGYETEVWQAMIDEALKAQS